MNKSESLITHAIVLYFVVSDWWFLNQSFLILDLGKHNIIIERWWLSENNVWLNVKNHDLMWSNEQTLRDELRVGLIKMISKKIADLNSDHQADVKIHDEKMIWFDEIIARIERRTPQVFMNGSDEFHWSWPINQDPQNSESEVEDDLQFPRANRKTEQPKSYNWHCSDWDSALSLSHTSKE